MWICTATPPTHVFMIYCSNTQLPFPYHTIIYYLFTLQAPDSAMKVE
jgi:hypothetical protein